MKSNTAKVLDVKTISTHHSYHGWPTVGLTESGELRVVVSAGRERHVCPFGQVHLLRSSDQLPNDVLANVQAAHWRLG